MLNIAIIDDRAKLRETIHRLINATVPEGWQCQSYPPLNDLNEYKTFINDEEISVLILDELLHEQAEDSDSHVKYNGHDVANYLRKFNSEFPIHIITSYKDNEALNDSGESFDSIYDRNEFIKNSEKIVPRLVRSAMRYIETNDKKLSEMTRLAQKKATDNLNQDEDNRLLALQEELNIKISTNTDSDIVGIVSNIESNLSTLDNLIDNINIQLKDS